MIPWLLVAGLIASRRQPLSAMVAERLAAFPCSGEINSTIENPPAVLERIEQHYVDSALETDHVDGLSMSFTDWRFNLRMSNTEPVVRLNVESRGDEALMEAKTAELLSLME
jgi:phosphomannomutase